MSMSGSGRRPAAARPAGWMTPISGRRWIRRRCRRQMSFHTGAASRRIREPTNYTDNFAIEADTSWRRPRSRLIAPLRLPRNSSRRPTAAMGQVDLDPDHGESDGARWFMTERNRCPTRRTQDARIPAGTVIPGRHRERRILQATARDDPMRGALGLRPLGARGEAPPRHTSKFDVADQDRRLHAASRRSITARSDIHGTSGPFVSRWNNARKYAR